VYRCGLRDESRFLVGHERLVAFPDYDTQLVLIETDGPADNLMKLSAGWAPVYSDELASLYVKQGSAAEQALTSAASAATRPAGGVACFP
jgi:hypothetical protein